MKKRIISAIVALIIVVPLLIIGGKPFTFGVGIISILGLKELIELKKHHKKIPSLMSFIAYICIFMLTVCEYDGYALAFGLTYKGIAITSLLLLTPTVLYKKDKYVAKDALYLLGGVLFLGVFCNALVLIRNINVFKVVYLILITTMTDSFAMIMGKLVGKHKLIPHVSPNKTVEGSVLGSVMGTVIATVFYLIKVADINVFKVILITLVLSVVGQFGDLVFSKIKRENKIKDFSNIMPGHGGILDRLDSLIFVVLAYLIVFNII